MYWIVAGQEGRGNWKNIEHSAHTNYCIDYSSNCFFFKVLWIRLSLDSDPKGAFLSLESGCFRILKKPKKLVMSSQEKLNNFMIFRFFNVSICDCVLIYLTKLLTARKLKPQKTAEIVCCRFFVKKRIAILFLFSHSNLKSLLLWI